MNCGDPGGRLSTTCFIQRVINLQKKEVGCEQERRFFISHSPILHVAMQIINTEETYISY